MKVSVLLLAFNEEKNLPACLDALEWCDDIVLVDSGSLDRSVEVARARGVRVLQRPFDDFAGQRNWGLDHAAFRHEWVLHLDADEIVTEEFRRALDALEAGETLDGYFVPSKMMLFGRWLKYAGSYPSYQVRLGHRDRLRFVQVGHGQREAVPPSRVGTFDVPYLHYSFSHGLFSWLNKHVRYARDEARLILADRAAAGGSAAAGGAVGRRRAVKRLAARVPVLLRPLLRFFYVYVVRQGFRDGRAGLAYAFMLSVYEGMTAIFVLEATLGDRTAAEERPGEH
ncbi:glycosyltransferase [Prosthecomicrobium pneumaticum]|uniref:Glycosyltransferase involved in cell wall biosynthesis n=1 Tax=Prosthecomicrobium pneumaticum TaxID=81895 RepID=A0A7W9CUF3_9HYPH|nr:glycosyltransferase involved in cell wall biosynthesis [Prosthecomicrobium pneumaticum]